MNELIVLQTSCDEAVDWVIERLVEAGLHATCSFNLRAALDRGLTRAHLGGLRGQPSFDLRTISAAPTACLCPHHGEATCDCQMVIILVYGQTGAPVTLVTHGHDGSTWISLADRPEQRAEPALEAAIVQAMAGDALSDLHHV